MSSINFNPADMGLTTAEAEAFVAAARSYNGELEALLGSSGLDKSDNFSIRMSERQRKGLMSYDDFALYLTAGTLGKFGSASVFEVTEPKISVGDDGIHTQHPSFGAASHHQSNSTVPNYVGTPCMDSNMICLRFRRVAASLGMSDQPRLSDGSELGEATLSSDQYINLIRHNGAGTPCAIGRMDYLLSDIPPRMVATVNITEEIQRKMSKVTAPVRIAIDDLQQMLGREQKISTKADYSLLCEKSEAIRAAMISSVPHLKALMQEAAGAVAEATLKQLEADILEPLARLGMDKEELLLTMF